MDLNECKNGIVNVFRSGMEQFIEQENEEAVRIQRRKDVMSAIRGFIDLKATDMMILELLQKHFDVESISEGKSYITDTRLQYQCDKLKWYLGLDVSEWIQYKRTYAIYDKLEANPKLLEMPVEKLKAVIEKK